MIQTAIHDRCRRTSKSAKVFGSLHRYWILVMNVLLQREHRKLEKMRKSHQYKFKGSNCPKHEDVRTGKSEQVVSFTLLREPIVPASSETSSRGLPCLSEADILDVKFSFEFFWREMMQSSQEENKLNGVIPEVNEPTTQKITNIRVCVVQQEIQVNLSSKYESCGQG